MPLHIYIHHEIEPEGLPDTPPPSPPLRRAPAWSGSSSAANPSRRSSTGQAPPGPVRSRRGGSRRPNGAEDGRARRGRHSLPAPGAAASPHRSHWLRRTRALALDGAPRAPSHSPQRLSLGGCPRLLATFLQWKGRVGRGVTNRQAALCPRALSRGRWGRRRGGGWVAIVGRRCLRAAVGPRVGGPGGKPWLLQGGARISCGLSPSAAAGETEGSARRSLPPACRR